MERGKPGDVLKECDADLAALVSLLFLFLCDSSIYRAGNFSGDLSANNCSFFEKQMQQRRL